MQLSIFALLIILITAAAGAGADAPTFTVDYDANTFRKDGQPFRYIAGTLHYFQIPHELWRDRMLRVRALGCNALQTYILWNRHETYEGVYNFGGDANITEYLRL